MEEEMLFRIVFWIILFLIIIFNRILPAILAKQKREKILPNKQAIRNEGKPLFIFRVLLGIPFFAFLVCYSIYPSFMDMLHLNIPLWLRWIGTLIAIVGVVFWIISQAFLGRNWSPQLQIQDDHKLIKRGPYKLIRHPIYTAMFIWAIGLALFTANIVFLFFAIASIIALVLRVPNEEKMMLDEFGDEYKEYRLVTGRFFPKLIKKR